MWVKLWLLGLLPGAAGRYRALMSAPLLQNEAENAGFVDLQDEALTPPEDESHMRRGSLMDKAALRLRGLRSLFMPAASFGDGNAAAFMQVANKMNTGVDAAWSRRRRRWWCCVVVVVVVSPPAPPAPPPPTPKPTPPPTPRPTDMGNVDHGTSAPGPVMSDCDLYTNAMHAIFAAFSSSVIPNLLAAFLSVESSVDATYHKITCKAPGCSKPALTDEEVRKGMCDNMDNELHQRSWQTGSVSLPLIGTDIIFGGMPAPPHNRGSRKFNKIDDIMCSQSASMLQMDDVGRISWKFKDEYKTRYGSTVDAPEAAYLPSLMALGVKGAANFGRVQDLQGGKFVASMLQQKEGTNASSADGSAGKAAPAINWNIDESEVGADNRLIADFLGNLIPLQEDGADAELTMVNADSYMDTSSSRSVKDSGNMRDDTVNKLISYDSSIRSSFKSLFTVQKAQQDQFDARMERDYAALDEAVLGAEEEEAAHFEMVDEAVVERMLAITEKTREQNGLRSDSDILRATFLDEWGDEETAEINALAAGEGVFEKVVDDYTSQLEKQTKNYVKEHSDTREENTDALNEMVEAFNQTDIDKYSGGEGLLETIKKHEEALNTKFWAEENQTWKQKLHDVQEVFNGTSDESVVNDAKMTIANLDKIIPNIATMEEEEQNEQAKTETNLETEVANVRLVGNPVTDPSPAAQGWVEKKANATRDQATADRESIDTMETELAAKIKKKVDDLRALGQEQEDEVVASLANATKTAQIEKAHFEDTSNLTATNYDTVNTRADKTNEIFNDVRASYDALMQALATQQQGLQQTLSGGMQASKLKMAAKLQDAQANAMAIGAAIAASMADNLGDATVTMDEKIEKMRTFLNAQATMEREELANLLFIFKSRSPQYDADPEIGIKEVPALATKWFKTDKHAREMLKSLEHELDTLEQDKDRTIDMAKQVLDTQKLEATRKLMTTVKDLIRAADTANFAAITQLTDGVSQWQGKLKEFEGLDAETKQYLKERVEGAEPVITEAREEVASGAASLQEGLERLEAGVSESVQAAAEAAASGLDNVAQKVQSNGVGAAKDELAKTVDGMSEAFGKAQESQVGQLEQLSGSLMAKLASGQAVTMADLLALGQAAQQQAYEDKQKAAASLLKQQQIAANADTAAQRAKLFAEQAKRDAGYVSQDEQNFLHRAGVEVDEQIGAELARQKHDTQLMTNGLMLASSKTKTNALETIGMVRHTLEDGTVIMTDMASLAREGIELDKEQVAALAAQYGVTIEQMEAMLAAERQAQQYKADKLKVSAEQLHHHLEMDEEKFNDFLTELGLDVEGLTAEEIAKLKRLKKEIDAKILKITLQQNKIFNAIEPALNASQYQAHAQRKAIIATATAIKDVIESKKFSLEQTANHTQDLAKSLKDKLEADRMDLGNEESRLRAYSDAQEEQLKKKLVEVETELPQQTMLANQEIDGIQSDVDALQQRMEELLKTPMFQTLRKLRDDDKWAQKAAREAYETSIYMEDFSKEQVDYMAALLHNLDIAAGHLRVHEEVERREQAQIEAQAAAREGALMNHLLGGANAGLDGSAIGSLGNDAMSSMLAQQAGRDANDAATFAMMNSSLAAHNANALGAFSAKEAELAAMRAKFGENGGSFADMASQLNKVLAYHEKMVREKKARVEERIKGVTDKVFDTGSWGANIPKIKGKDELLPWYVAKDIRDNATAEVLDAYNAAPPTDTNEEEVEGDEEQAIDEPDATDANGAAANQKTPLEQMGSGAASRLETRAAPAASLLETADGSMDAELRRTEVLMQKLHEQELKKKQLGSEVSQAYAEWKDRAGAAHGVQSLST